MEYPYCGEELNYDTYWGRICAHQDGHVEGDIYSCENEDCEMYQESFHVYRSNPDDIHEGYPC